LIRETEHGNSAYNALRGEERREEMTKADLIAAVAEKVGLSKKQTEEVLDVAVEGIKKAVKKDGEFRYPGLGVFKLKKRNARTGINPQTGEKIKIKASKTVGFRPASSFKDSL
jgi:DNA-binding protein HU-beta